MIDATFQLLEGLGPRRERQLWRAGLRCWDDVVIEERLSDGAARVMPARLHEGVVEAVGEARRALAARDVAALSARVAGREAWRLFAAFAEDTAYLDIETDFDGVTAIGLLDRHGPRIFLAGRDLGAFPAAIAGAQVLVTFNGASFDVPVLRQAFPDWTPPPAHVDLCHVWRRLGHHGGLKRLEEEVGIGRPSHLRGMSGADAVGLWRRAQWGDHRALRAFAEYNLYDTVNLRTLMAMAYNRLVADAAEHGLCAAPVPVSYRGDVLYDLTRELLRVVPEAA